MIMEYHILLLVFVLTA